MLWKQLGTFRRRNVVGKFPHDLGQGPQIQGPRVNAIEGIFSEPVFVKGGNDRDFEEHGVEIADAGCGGIPEGRGNGDYKCDKSHYSKCKTQELNKETAKHSKKKE